MAGSASLNFSPGTIWTTIIHHIVSSLIPSSSLVVQQPLPDYWWAAFPYLNLCGTRVKPATQYAPQLVSSCVTDTTVLLCHTADGEHLVTGSLLSAPGTYSEQIFVAENIAYGACCSIYSQNNCEDKRGKIKQLCFAVDFHDLMCSYSLCLVLLLINCSHFVRPLRRSVSERRTEQTE
jgi:hypothetical protein